MSLLTKKTGQVNNEDLLQKVMDNIPQFIFWKDTDCVYMGCNMNFAIGAGLSDPSEIIGKTDYDLPWTKEADLYRATDFRIMKSGKKELNFEEPQTNGGEQKWLRTSKIPLFDKLTNEVIGILGTYEDITERKQMELDLIKKSEALKSVNEELVESNKSLELANIDLEHFAYATSHDMQEPLRMIGGFVSLLEKRIDDKLDEETITFFQFIKEGTQRMSAMIRDVLTYSKLGKETDSFQKVDLNFIVNEKLKDLSLYIEEKSAEVNVNLPHIHVWCEPTQIGMVFYNLILNGIKFNKSEIPVVNVSWKETDLFYEFRICDNGIGIEDIYKDTIFKPFKRLHTRRDYAGVGIGLSICKRILALHNGSLNVENNEVGGSRFVFEIPKKVR